MEEQIITLETAKLAKNKGYLESCLRPYDNKGNLLKRDYDNCEYLITDGIYSAPTQSLLQKWLREEHDINVFIGFRPNSKKWDSHAYSLNLNGKEYVNERPLKKFINQDVFNTYEEALEAGLQEALKLIE